MRHLTKTFFLMATMLFLAGCDPLKIKEAADRLGASVDDSTRQFMYAVATAAQQSKEWRAEIDKLGNQFQITAEMIPIGFGTQSRMFVDFAIRRLKDNPAAINNVTKLINDGKLILALQAFQKLQEENPLGRLPEIGQASPSHLPIAWIDHDNYKVDRDIRVVDFNGWDIPLGAQLEAEVRDANDRVLRSEKGHLKAITRYDAVLDVSPGSGIKFSEADRTILIKYNGKLISQLSVTWGERPGPPPPTIDRVIFRIRTVQDNKEVNGRIFLSLLDHGGKVLFARGPFGENDDWKDGDGGPDGTKRAFGLPDSEADHSTRIPAPPGSQFTARIRLETFRANGLILDAVKWNCTWTVLLMHWNGHSYVKLGEYEGKKHFHADLIQDADINITITK